MKLLVIGASTSSTSINQKFARFAAAQIEDADKNILSLRDIPLPIYSEDEEKENGVPEDAHILINAIKESDAIVLSLAEHNGSYTAAFKNIYDWASRIEYKVWQEKPMLLLSTSPGGRGGAGVLEAAKNTFSHMGGNIAASFSLPSFGDNFSDGSISDSDLKAEFDQSIEQFKASL